MAFCNDSMPVVEKQVYYYIYNAVALPLSRIEIENNEKEKADEKKS